MGNTPAAKSSTFTVPSLPTLKGVLQSKLQNPHVSRGADLAEELVVQGRKICRRNGQPRRNVRPEAVGHVISLDAKLHPLLFPDSEVARQRHVERPEFRGANRPPVCVPDRTDGRLAKRVFIQPEGKRTARRIFVRIGQDLIGWLIPYRSSV